MSPCKPERLTQHSELLEPNWHVRFPFIRPGNRPQRVHQRDTDPPGRLGSIPPDGPVAHHPREVNVTGCPGELQAASCLVPGWVSLRSSETGAVLRYGGGELV